MTINTLEITCGHHHHHFRFKSIFPGLHGSDKSETDQPEMKYWPFPTPTTVFWLWASSDQVYTSSNLQQRSPNCLCGCLLIFRPRKDGRLSGSVAEPGVEPFSSAMRGGDASHCATATICPLSHSPFSPFCLKIKLKRAGTACITPIDNTIQDSKLLQ